jgi:DNA modification methylase
MEYFEPGNGFKPKDLMMIPSRVAIALQDDGWWLRSDIIWHKTTAMPEPVTDRPVSAHEHIFLLAKSERYFYDAEAIREPLKPKTLTTFGIKHRSQGNDALGRVKSDNWGSSIEERKPRLTADGEIAGANKRNVWPIASQPYHGAHFATFPPKLIEPCILAGASPKACEYCGAPWQRITCKELAANPGGGQKRASTTQPGNSPIGATSVFRTGMSRVSHTAGWEPTCTCSNQGMGKCIVLDPFMGAGTVALVALQFGRDYLGIEINQQYINLANERIAIVQPTLWTA